MADALYPECEKWAKVADSGRIILEYMEWYHNYVNDYIPADNPGSDEQMVYRFFGIDPDKLEAERRAMLEALQNAPAQA